MIWKRIIATKSLEMLHAEMLSDNRLRRVLGPIGLTSLGVGAIIGAGIFVMTGRVAAQDAGPAVMLSYTVAAIACGLAAFCYAEFASMAPVAGSAYTYAYATLGELFAWIIGWDLVLEYAMSAATVAASWSKYFNEFLEVTVGWRVPDYLCHDPFSHPGAWFNLPAVLILALVTTILVVGIRESAASNTALVILKLGVVLFVIGAGLPYIQGKNYTGIDPDDRILPAERVMLSEATRYVEKQEPEKKDDIEDRAKTLAKFARADFRIARALKSGDAARIQLMQERFGNDLPTNVNDIAAAKKIVAEAEREAPHQLRRTWGMLGLLGLSDLLGRLDDATRTSFMPYGISGVMLGAALVFFAFLGFDSVSTHSEEAIKPQRDVPIGILGSLVICTILYLGVSFVITGMVPYPEIDPGAAVASGFRKVNMPMASALIAAGGLAGMTSVLLITFLSQARIFLAMARDGLLPHSVFGAVHHEYKTPHVSTMVTGVLMMVVAALTPIEALEEMVNIGTFFAFVVVCAAVLVLRIKRPDAERPFRCPAVWIVAPLGIGINVAMMLFLAIDTWLRLVIWLAIGLVVYFAYGYRHSVLGKESRRPV